MSNDKVLIAFLNHEKAHTPTRVINQYDKNISYKGQTLSTDGQSLINYQTQIAYWRDSILYVNTNKYSSTTSHIQSKLKRLAQERDITIVEYSGEV